MGVGFIIMAVAIGIDVTISTVPTDGCTVIVGVGVALLSYVLKHPLQATPINMIAATSTPIMVLTLGTYSPPLNLSWDRLAIFNTPRDI
jgi:hypothetical protein